MIGLRREQKVLRLPPRTPKNRRERAALAQDDSKLKDDVVSDESNI